jgi:TM2 domain-containing membrane protein YozV
MASPPSDPKKPPTVAPVRYDWSGAFLSFLIPGLGQIFQGRVGKGILFLVCIYGLFFYGMYLGSWKNVFVPRAALYKNHRVTLGVIRDLIDKDGVPAAVAEKLAPLVVPPKLPGQEEHIPENPDATKDFLRDVDKLLEPAEKEKYRTVILARTGTATLPEVVLPLGIRVPKPIAYRVPYLGQFWVGIVAWPALVQYWMFDENLDADRDAPVFGKFMRAPTEAETNKLQNESDKTWDFGWVYTVIAGVLNIMVIYDALVGPAFIPAAAVDDRKKKTGVKNAAG